MPCLLKASACIKNKMVRTRKKPPVEVQNRKAGLFFALRNGKNVLLLFVGADNLLLV